MSNTLSSSLKKIVMKLNIPNWKNYAFEFLSIFIAVVSAFALSSWHERQNDEASAEKILLEIRNSIDKDAHDFQNNISGNNFSLRADVVFQDLLKLEPVPQDSMGLFYLLLFRDYIPVINKSAYNSLTTNNLKLIANDSLRLQIIGLYDYYYRIIEALEYDVPEMQSYSNYFAKINDYLHPYINFDPTTGKLISFDPPIDLTEKQKNEIRSYLWRIRNNRHFKLARYELIIKQMEQVKQNIETELAK